MARVTRIFHLQIPADLPVVRTNWTSCTVGWADHVARLDTAVKRKMFALAKNQNLPLRCSADNAVSTVTVLTYSYQLRQLTLSVW